jgi:hypothetical protein
MRDRIVDPTHAVEGETHIAMKIGDSIVAAYCPAKEIERQLMTPVLECNDTDEVQTVGVIWLDRENFPASLLGFVKPPGPVQGHGILERLADIHWKLLNSSLLATP